MTVTSVQSVLIAMLCYAAANVVLEQKLAHYNALTLLVCWSGAIMLLATVARFLLRGSDVAFDFPTGESVAWVALLVVLFFAADYSYVHGFTTGGDLYTLTCVTMLMPVFASLMKLAWTGTPPNLWHVGAYLTGTLAVFLVAKGNSG